MHVLVNGVRLFFDVDGAKLVPDGPLMRERPTLLLLHGGPGMDHSGYKNHFPALTDVAQVVYLDHRGNGRSEAGPRSAWTLAQWGDDVRAFCEALGIEKPIVFGQSFGGYVAMSYATRHPDHPGKLVLCSTSARRDSSRCLAVYERLGGPEAREAARRWEEAPRPEAFQDFVRFCFPLYFKAPIDGDAIRRTVMNHALLFDWGPRERASFDFTRDLARIACPTLILGGEDDPVTPIEDQADIAAAIRPDLVRFERFAGAGHGVLIDQPERALAVLREFVAAA